MVESRRVRRRSKMKCGIKWPANDATAATGWPRPCRRLDAANARTLQRLIRSHSVGRSAHGLVASAGGYSVASAIWGVDWSFFER